MIHNLGDDFDETPLEKRSHKRKQPMQEAGKNTGSFYSLNLKGLEHVHNFDHI